MALTHHPHRRDTVSRDEQAYDDRPREAGTEVDERQTVRSGEGLNTALRAVGAVAGGVAMVFGIVALLRIDWNNGFDSPPVEVGGLLFTPAVAVATTVLGLFALGAGAARDRASKLVVGAILGCTGLAVLIAGSSRANWDLESGHGWLALIVGAVLVVTGLLMRHSLSTRRTVRTDGYRA